MPFLPFKILLYKCLHLGYRLNTNGHKKLRALDNVSCVEMCVDDKCCRSTNFLKTLDLDKEKDGDNCELLHDAVVSTESGRLVQNDNYDHFTLNIPARVSIYLTV